MASGRSWEGDGGACNGDGGACNGDSARSTHLVHIMRAWHCGPHCPASSLWAGPTRSKARIKLAPPPRTHARPAADPSRRKRVRAPHGLTPRAIELFAAMLMMAANGVMAATALLPSERRDATRRARRAGQRPCRLTSPWAWTATTTQCPPTTWYVAGAVGRRRRAAALKRACPRTTGACGADRARRRPPSRIAAPGWACWWRSCSSALSVPSPWRFSWCQRHEVRSSPAQPGRRQAG